MIEWLQRNAIGVVRRLERLGIPVTAGRDGRHPGQGRYAVPRSRRQTLTRPLVPLPVRAGLSAGLLSAPIIESRFRQTRFLDTAESRCARNLLHEDATWLEGASK